MTWTMEQKSFETPEGSIVYWTSTPHKPHLPWLVLLPGITSDHRIFDLQIPELTAKANILTWDAPSHGLSRPFPLTWSFDQLAQWLHDILKHESASQIVLAGHSMGGYLAQVYAELYAAEVSGFIGLDTAPLQRSYYRGIELFFLQRIHHMYQFMNWDSLKRRSIASNAHTADARCRAGEILAGYDKASYSALMAAGFRAHVEEVLRGRTYKLLCPALLLCGEYDTTGAAKRTMQEWSQKEDLPLRLIPHAAHNVTWDNPTEVNAAISEFLETLQTHR